MHKTTMVLTVDVPPELNERLREAAERHPGLSLRDIALAALVEWLDRDEAGEAQ